MCGVVGLGVQGPDLRGPGRKYSWFSALSASGLGFTASEVLVKIQVSLALFRWTPKAKCSRVGFKVRQLRSGPGTRAQGLNLGFSFNGDPQLINPFLNIEIPTIIPMKGRRCSMTCLG